MTEIEYPAGFEAGHQFPIAFAGFKTFFFFNDTATTEIYTLSLHDALPIRERFPDHDIVTEETAIARTGSRYLWLIDPLDGTVNFAHGYPFFCASVGVAVDGQVVAGAVYDPIKHELFTAERGAGAHLNGRRLRVSRSSELIKSLLVTGFPYDIREDLPGKLRWFNRLMGRARAERLNAWDMAAGNLVVEEAGGRVSRFDGKPLGLEPDEILATNGGIHEAMIAVLQEAGKPSHAAGRR